MNLLPSQNVANFLSGEELISKPYQHSTYNKERKKSLPPGKINDISAVSFPINFEIMEIPDIIS